MSNDPARNPYVVLGLPFGADPDSATAAFARRARGLRRAADGSERLKDLTWALNQVQEAHRARGTDMTTYRVPALVDAYRAHGPGVLDPAPRLEPRTTEHAGELEALLDAARHEAHVEARADVARSAALPPR